MIDRRVVCGKLSQLRERTRLLTTLAAEPRDVFVTDPVKVSATERLLQVSIEVCLDVGHHVIAAMGFPQPEEYRDVFRILGTHGVLSPEFADRLERMASFRNRLVHVYGEIDPQQVYDFLQRDRGDFDEFARSMAAFVAQSGA